ncbi:MAG: universal stress protein [Burkholderiales bacterium]|nr:universal stress protein [Burkholderiales bacterium]MDE2455684.1 universal stress protein [Burkholderiales bacterium]
MYKRILVPVDASYLTERAIHASIELARQLGAAITAFVAEPVMPPPSGQRPRAWLEADAREHDAMTEAHARQVLARFEARARDAGIEFKGVYEQVPRVDQAIIDSAEACGCDLIVMVTHGRGAFGEFLFGSHTKAVLAGSSLPLLVLH